MNRKFREITLRDLLEVGDIFDVPQGGRLIVEEVTEAVAGWEREARAADVPAVMVRRIGGRLHEVAERL